MNKLPENIHLNPNADYVQKLQKIMKENGGYCPCRIQHKEENLCICQEFREQMKDPGFEGYCHCKLYYKEK